MYWVFRVATTWFFIGLAGCALTVIISWVSIVKSGFSPDDTE